jgi:hypothetical protein
MTLTRAAVRAGTTGQFFSQAIPSLSRSRPLFQRIATRYRLVLWKKFLTGSPEVLSLAPNLPRPCGYRLFRLVQFFYRAGAAASAVPAANARPSEAASSAAIRFIAHQGSRGRVVASTRIRDRVDPSLLREFERLVESPST